MAIIVLITFSVLSQLINPALQSRIATPEFHHWHHIKVPRVHNKNFAAQFPLLDLLFGTLYLPVDKIPKQYGISERVPIGYL
jgi:sterol desaturase/sphingolipid hydroxylase (fatty acid hydroxylase superfamily)